MNVELLKLSKLPDYGTDAGGFAGLLYGGEVRTLNVELAVPQNSPAPHVNNFGGIASICDNSAMINDANITVDSEHSIVPATSKAGGAFATTDRNCSINNVKVHLTKGGTIRSATTAGFVVSNGNGVHITNSYVEGYVSDNAETANVSGFVFQNGGTIERCFVDVTMSEGNVFATVNNAKIKNCYGWTTHGDFTYPAGNQNGTCVSSYFASKDTSKPNVDLYDSKGDLSDDIVYTDALASTWALDLLNGTLKEGEKGEWELGSKGYPKLRGMASPDNLPAPTGGNYSYGVLYVENDGAGVYMTDLSGNGNTKFTLDQVGTVSSAEYYVYHRTAANTPSGLGSALPYNTFEGLGLNQLYSIYPVTGDGSVTINFSDTEQSISMNTHYGPINSDGYYRIRTSDHFKNIKHNTSGNFCS